MKAVDVIFTAAFLVLAFDVVANECEAVEHGGYRFHFECSMCGYSAIVHNCSSRLDELPSYCPSCGRKVRS